MRGPAVPDVVLLFPLPSRVSVTWTAMSSHRPCFPLEVRSDAGLPSLDGVRRHSFPRVVATIGPSDSRFAFGPSSGLPCFRPSASNRARGYLRFQDHPLRARRTPRPRRVHRPMSCHRVTGGCCCPRVSEPLGTHDSTHFGANFLRLTRLPTYASPDSLPSRFCPLTFTPVARLATDVPGWLRRVGIAPTG